MQNYPRNNSNTSSCSNLLSLSSSEAEQPFNSGRVKIEYYKKFISKVGQLLNSDPTDLDALYYKIEECVDKNKNLSQASEQDIDEMIETAKEIKDNNSLLKNMVSVLDRVYLSQRKEGKPEQKVEKICHKEERATGSFLKKFTQPKIFETKRACEQVEEKILSDSSRKSSRSSTKRNFYQEKIKKLRMDIEEVKGEIFFNEKSQSTETEKDLSVQTVLQQKKTTQVIGMAEGYIDKFTRNNQLMKKLICNTEQQINPNEGRKNRPNRVSIKQIESQYQISPTSEYETSISTKKYVKQQETQSRLGMAKKYTSLRELRNVESQTDVQQKALERTDHKVEAVVNKIEKMFTNFHFKDIGGNFMKKRYQEEQKFLQKREHPIATVNNLSRPNSKTKLSFTYQSCEKSRGRSISQEKNQTSYLPNKNRTVIQQRLSQPFIPRHQSEKFFHLPPRIMTNSPYIIQQPKIQRGYQTFSHREDQSIDMHSQSYRPRSRSTGSSSKKGGGIRVCSKEKKRS